MVLRVILCGVVVQGVVCYLPPGGRPAPRCGAPSYIVRCSGAGSGVLPTSRGRPAPRCGAPSYIVRCSGAGSGVLPTSRG